MAKLSLISTKLRKTFYPNIHDKEVKRYFKDGGDEKFRYTFDLNDKSLVFDIGGYKGQWASDIYSRYNCNIFIFEPIATFSDQIKDRFKLNKKIKVFNFALGAKNRTEFISICEDASSTYLNSSLKKKINFIDVKDFFAENSIKTISLMKINIEGGEYELIPRLIETGIINKIDQIQVQFHNIGSASEKNMEKIHSELLLTHKCTQMYKFVWENWERINH